jgi:hypothetical protein
MDLIVEEILDTVVKCAAVSPNRTVTKSMVVAVLRQMGMTPESVHVTPRATAMGVPSVLANLPRAPVLDRRPPRGAGRGNGAATNAGAHTAGAPTAGAPTAGVPTAGVPTAGASTAGASTAGASTAGASTAGASTAGASNAPARKRAPRKRAPRKAAAKK